MTQAEEEKHVRDIETARVLYRKCAAKCHEHGASYEAALFGALHATMDLATGYRGHDPVAAIAWLRGAVDYLESQVAQQCGSTVQ